MSTEDRLTSDLDKQELRQEDDVPAQVTAGEQSRKESSVWLALASLSPYDYDYGCIISFISGQGLILPGGAHGGQRTTCRNRFSISTIFAEGIELRASSRSAMGVFTC